MSNGTEKIIEFRNALYNLFNSNNGKIVLDFLNEAYVESPALSETQELTYYRLGQKEFVQGLIKDAQTSPEDLKKLTGGN